MAMARQNIQPQNHFKDKPDLFICRKYKPIISKTASSKELIKKLLLFVLLKLAAMA